MTTSTGCALILIALRWIDPCAVTSMYSPQVISRSHDETKCVIRGWEITYTVEMPCADVAAIINEARQ